MFEVGVVSCVGFEGDGRASRTSLAFLTSVAKSGDDAVVGERKMERRFEGELLAFIGEIASSSATNVSRTLYVDFQRLTIQTYALLLGHYRRERESVVCSRLGFRQQVV